MGDLQVSLCEIWLSLSNSDVDEATAWAKQQHFLFSTVRINLISFLAVQDGVSVTRRSGSEEDEDFSDCCKTMWENCLRVIEVTKTCNTHEPGADLAGGCRGCGGCAPPPPEMTCSFLIQLVFCKKKTMWLTGVVVEQETSAPPPKYILDPPL